jgi:hypothetical protein
LRTDVLKIRLYSSKDNRQHQYFVLIYIAIVVLWLATIIYRSLNDSVKRAAMIAGAILLGWICVRLIKYQFVFADIWNRHLMYAYYPFQLALPLVLLWLAWAIDKPGDAKLSMPNWLKITIVVNAVIAVLVLTNELHYLVFPIAGLTPSGSVQHGYGIGHYFVLAGSVLPVLAALIILFKNNRENTRKSGLLFTLAFVLLLAAYGYGYINRIPIAWESDRTMVIGLFTLIFTEVLIRAGVIPVNTKYNALFANSPLGVSITDKDRQTVWASATVPHDSARNQEVFAQALASFPIPAQQDENTLLFATDITGGYVQWQEDISDLNRLHQEIASSVEKLTAANTMLSEEESIKRAALEETEKTKIMEQLEAEIPEHITKLSVMIEHLESQEDNPSAVARIILLLCYVKRRCGLFFREKEAAAIPHYELSLYLDELAKTTECSEKVIVTSELNSPVPVRYATLIYDVFNNVFDWAMGLGDPQMLAHLRIKGDYLVLGIFPSSDVRTFQLDTVLQTAIAQVGGIYEVVDLDEEVGLRFSFPIGGEANG